jgi:hypothetical protein
MTVQKLQKDLQKLLDDGKIQLDSEVCFLHTMRDPNSDYSTIHYMLHKQTKKKRIFSALL